MIKLQMKTGRIPYTLSSMLNCQNPYLDTENIFPFEKRFVFMAGAAGGSGSGQGGAKEKTGVEKEEEKKKREDEAKKAKEKEEKQKKPGENEEEEGENEEINDVEKTTSSVASQAKETAGTAEKLAEVMQVGKSDTEKANALKMRGLQGEFNAINSEDEKADRPVKKYLDQLVYQKKIKPKKAQELLKLDPNNEDFQTDWASATKGLKGLPKTSEDMQKLLALKTKTAKKQKLLERRFAEAKSKMWELSREMHDKMIHEADQNRAKERLKNTQGIAIKEGQVLTYVDIYDEEKKRRQVEVKKIEFEEIPILDDNGNVIKKVPSLSPIVTIKSIHSADGKLGEEKFTMSDLNQWVEGSDVVEKIDSLKTLKESIGLRDDFKPGLVFEYRRKIITGREEKEGDASFQNISVKIETIDENNKTITLDQEVDTFTESKKTLTFGEFARWYKKNNVIKEITSLDELQKALYAIREVRIAEYSLKAAQYPPIEVKEGEVLYYEDGSKQTFVIKEVNEKEKKIALSDGKHNYEPKSFSDFLRWVKDHNVEKMTGSAEAEKAASLAKTPEEKEAIMAEAKKSADRDLAELGENSEKLPPGFVEPFPEAPVLHHIGYLKKVWSNTHFMSLLDFWEMGKTIVEFVKRKLKRMQGGRIGALGEAIFGPASKALAAEFTGLKKHAESEEVSHHTKHFETMGVDEIRHEMQGIGRKDKDILKAAITVLAKKGAMRWDDPRFWDIINSHTGGVPEIKKSNYFEVLDKIFEQWWGADVFKDFRHSQDSGYEGVKKGFEDHAKRLEGDPGGVKLQLQKLLGQFLKGEYVNGAQYESYLSWAMQAGKMQFEDKMFFLIMGIGTTNPNGETLLSVDRASALDAQFLRNIPLIEFFISPLQQKYRDDGEPVWKKGHYDESGKWQKGAPETERPGIGAFKHWINNHILPDLNVGSMEEIRNLNPEKITWKPGGKFADFVRDTIAFDEYAHSRFEKASSDPSNWDHDDMDIFVGLLDETTVRQITRLAGGARMQVSFSGIKTALAGSNDFMLRKIKNLDKKVQEGDEAGATRELKQLTKLIKAFMTLDGIIDWRYDHKTVREHFTGDIYNRPPLCDPSRNIKYHLEEVRHMVKELIKRLNLGVNAETIFTRLNAVDRGDDNKIKKQEAEFDEFNRQIGEKMEEYVEAKKFKDVSNLLVDIQNEAGDKALKGIKKTAITRTAAERAME